MTLLSVSHYFVMCLFIKWLMFCLFYSCGSNLQFLALCWCWEVTDSGLEQIVNNCRYNYMPVTGDTKCSAKVTKQLVSTTFLQVFIGCPINETAKLESMSMI